MRYTDSDWCPTRVFDVGKSMVTSTGVTRILTDAGWAYCKPLGNRQGPHALACEWVAVQLARWFGLPTFKAAIIHLRPEWVFPLPPHKGARYHALPGPAFLTQDTAGHTWSSTPDELTEVINPHDICRLVCFDMWVRNRDRHHHARNPNYGNVFLARLEHEERPRLLAMDHTHCFDNGQLTPRLGHIDAIQDEVIYGLFPEFVPYLSHERIRQCAARLREMDRELAAAYVDELPDQWEVAHPSRNGLVELIWRRALYLHEHLERLLIRSVA